MSGHEVIERLIEEVVALRRSVAALSTQEMAPTWIPWTPTVTQSVSVTATVVEARYMVVGKVCHIAAILIVTGSGTAGQPIRVGGIPAAAMPAVSNMAIGQAHIVDAGTGNYEGTVILNAATFLFVVHNTTAAVGQQPNFGLANGDTITFSATYRVA